MHLSHGRDGPKRHTAGHLQARFRDPALSLALRLPHPHLSGSPSSVLAAADPSGEARPEISICLQTGTRGKSHRSSLATPAQQGMLCLGCHYIPHWQTIQTDYCSCQTGRLTILAVTADEIASEEAVRGQADPAKRTGGRAALTLVLEAAGVLLDHAQAGRLRSAAQKKPYRSAEHACCTGARGAAGQHLPAAPASLQTCMGRQTESQNRRP